MKNLKWVWILFIELWDLQLQLVFTHGAVSAEHLSHWLSALRVDDYKSVCSAAAPADERIYNMKTHLDGGGGGGSDLWDDCDLQPNWKHAETEKRETCWSVDSHVWWRAGPGCQDHQHISPALPGNNCVTRSREGQAGTIIQSNTQHTHRGNNQPQETWHRLNHHKGNRRDVSDSPLMPVVDLVDVSKHDPVLPFQVLWNSLTGHGAHVALNTHTHGHMSLIKSEVSRWKSKLLSQFKTWMLQHVIDEGISVIYKGHKQII